MDNCLQQKNLVLFINTKADDPDKLELLITKIYFEHI